MLLNAFHVDTFIYQPIKEPLSLKIQNTRH